MNDLTILWLDDKREPYKYFAQMEKAKAKNKEISSLASQRNYEFYSNNLFNNYNVKFDWVKNIEEFASYIQQNGMPEFISFDRDLTVDKNNPLPDGLDCIKWLKQYCTENNLKMPKCFVHSANWKHIPQMEEELGAAALKQAWSGVSKTGKKLSIGESVTHRKKKIVLSEAQLKTIIRKAVRNVLNETMKR